MEFAGPLQIRCLNHIWKHGPSTVHEIVNGLNKGAKIPVAYTTVLTVMSNLVKRKFCTAAAKGQASKNRGGVAYIFTATKTKDEYRTEVLTDIITTLFEGEPVSLRDFIESSF